MAPADGAGSPPAFQPNGAPDPNFWLPLLGPALHPSSSSTAAVHWTPVLSSSTALVPLPPGPAPAAPTFRMSPMLRSEGSELAVRPSRKWLLEPVRMSGEERIITRFGAPPRRNALAADALALLTTSPSAAAEAAHQELTMDHTLRTAQPPPPCQVRLPPVPRMTSSRRRRPCAYGLKALPPNSTSSGTTAKHLLQLRQECSTEVMEARYTRDISGKKNSFWRSSLDQDILDQDFEVAAMADYRQAACFYYQHVDRDKASNFREASSRKRGLGEVQWKLQQGLIEVGKKPLGDDDADSPRATQDADDTALPPAPRNSPCESKKKGRPSLRSQKAKRGRRPSTIMNEVLEGEAGTQEGYEPSDSDDGNGNDKDSKKVANKLKEKCLKFKRPLRARMNRLNRNGKEFRHLKRRLQGVSPSPSAVPSGHSKKANKAVAFGAPSASSSGMSSSDEMGEEAEKEFDLADITRQTIGGVHHRASQVAAFLQWNEQDQLDLRRVFERYDANHSDSLDQSELTVCLAELGLRGKNETERCEVREILWAIDKLEVGFYEFATQVVPSIRKRLATLQVERLRAAFTEADVDKSGMLSIDETMAELRLMGTFPSEDQVKDAICQVCPEAAAVSQNINGDWLTTRDVLDLHSFSALILMLQEKVERDRSEMLRRIVLEFNLSEADRDAFQHTLVDMHTVFKRFSKFHPVSTQGRPLNTVFDAAFVIRECGLAPRNVVQRHLITSIVGEEADEEGHVDFKAIVKVAVRLRDNDRQWLHKIFHKHDVNKSGGLHFGEVSHALAECGIKARTKHETDEIVCLIAEFDEDGSGEVDTEEFVDLFRFVSERIHKVQREVERQTSVRFGWTDKQFDELRGAFMAFDQDASETLEVHEMLQAVENLQHTHLREDINPVMREASIAPDSKRVDFLAFMQIMKALEVREHQRTVAKRFGFEGEAVNRLRAAFKDLQPDEAGTVLKDTFTKLLVDSGAPKENSLTDIQKEMMNWCRDQIRVDFEVFVKFMKKKMEQGVQRRNSVGV